MDAIKAGRDRSYALSAASLSGESPAGHNSASASDLGHMVAGMRHSVPVVVPHTDAMDTHADPDAELDRQVRRDSPAASAAARRITIASHGRDRAPPPPPSHGLELGLGLGVGLDLGLRLGLSDAVYPETSGGDPEDDRMATDEPLVNLPSAAELLVIPDLEPVAAGGGVVGPVERTLSAPSSHASDRRVRRGYSTEQAATLMPAVTAAPEVLGPRVSWPLEDLASRTPSSVARGGSRPMWPQQTARRTSLPPPHTGNAIVGTSHGRNAHRQPAPAAAAAAAATETPAAAAV